MRDGQTGSAGDLDATRVGEYRPPSWLWNGHLQTLYPALARRTWQPPYVRERLDTPDGDFLDLDWCRPASAAPTRPTAIVGHGLEGNSRRGYIRGMTRTLNRRGWNVVAWNCRGCGGEINRTLRFYHSGSTDDLDLVVRHVTCRSGGAPVALIGFSLGGNIVLKYLGERGASVDPSVRAAAAISVPCDLRASSLRMADPENRVYMRAFLRSLHAKIKTKMARYPGRLDDRGFDRIRTFQDFDDRYTAPLHGFADAEDYWRQSSSLGFLPGIAVPTLLLNARNDPFLAATCFPSETASANPRLHADFQKSGGHVGFVSFGSGGEYWSERRVASFLAGTGSFDIGAKERRGAAAADPSARCIPRNCPGTD